MQVNKRGKAITVWCVDPDKNVRQFVKGLSSDVLRVYAFQKVSACLSAIRHSSRGVMLVDYTLFNGSNPDCLEQVKRLSPTILIIGMGSGASIAYVVELLKKGLFDFLTKPLHAINLLHAITSATEALQLRFNLTPNEEKVLALVMEGKSSKEIAHLLHRSVRTIEDHRTNINKKIGARSPADIVKYGIQYFSKMQERKQLHLNCLLKNSTNISTDSSTRDISKNT